MLKIYLLVFVLLSLTSCKSKNNNSRIKRLVLNTSSTTPLQNVDNFCSKKEKKTKILSIYNYLTGASPNDKKSERALSSFKQDMFDHVFTQYLAQALVIKFPYEANNKVKLNDINKYISSTCKNWRNMNSYTKNKHYYKNININISKIKNAYFSSENVQVNTFKQVNSTNLNQCKMKPTTAHIKPDIYLNALNYICNNKQTIDSFLENPVAVSSLIADTLSNRALDLSTRQEKVENYKLGYCAQINVTGQIKQGRHDYMAAEIVALIPISLALSSQMFIARITEFAAKSVFKITTGVNVKSRSLVAIASEVALAAITLLPKWMWYSGYIQKIEGLKIAADTGLPTKCQIDMTQKEEEEIKTIIALEGAFLLVSGYIAAVTQLPSPALYATFKGLWATGMLKIGLRNSSSTIRRLNESKNATRHIETVKTLARSGNWDLKAIAVKDLLQKTLLGFIGTLVTVTGGVAAYEEYSGAEVSAKEFEDGISQLDLIPQNLLLKAKDYEYKIENFEGNLLQPLELLDSVVQTLDSKSTSKLDPSILNKITLVLRSWTGRVIKKFAGEESIFGRIAKQNEIVKFCSKSTNRCYKGFAVETYIDGFHSLLLYEPSPNTQKIIVRVFPAKVADKKNSKILKKYDEATYFSKPMTTLARHSSYYLHDIYQLGKRCRKYLKNDDAKLPRFKISIKGGKKAYYYAKAFNIAEHENRRSGDVNIIWSFSIDTKEKINRLRNSSLAVRESDFGKDISIIGYDNACSA